MAFNFPESEQKILKFWQEKKIFEELRKKNQGNKRWSFLDGPITANNPMGVHHAWGRTYKDLFQRYNAMKGFNQRYQNGFDCQGLWVEVEVEKELGFKTKKDIEAYGIDKFVEKCKERVRKYSAIQTRQSIRLGQWMDWDNSYYTMSEENNYSIWHFLKKCWKDGNLYKGRDAVPWCPRCGTAISQHEILAEEYKNIIHESVYVEFPIESRKNEYLLVWTTTPWTLPGNVAVAADPEKEYVKASGNVAGNFYYLSKTAAERLKLKIEKTVKGAELIGLKYQSPFDSLPNVKRTMGKYDHRVEASDPLILPITEEEGTGLVHIAPGAGSEDFKLAKKLNLPVIELINEEAVYIDGMGDFSGKNAKENPKIILDYLVNFENGRYFFDIAPYTHQYPTCWRCKKELVWRVVDEWYIRMDKMRGRLMEIVKKINWIPPFGLERELDWLKNMQDWLISKKRYWGLALPIFECQKCGNFEVIGSKEELKERAIDGWDKFEGHTPHRPWIDEVKIKCSKCGAVASRIKDVGNPWLDAGIVPFSTLIDPETKKVSYLTDKKYWQKWFPFDFVCESFPGQFKNWFYAIIVMAAVLENTNPAKTIFGFASVRDEKGEEMHKSKGNAIWFDDAVEKIGADPMRWMYARQNPADNLKFGYSAAEETKRKLLTLYNVFVFFFTFVDRKEFPGTKIDLKFRSMLDKWIAGKVDELIKTTNSSLDVYDAAKAVLAAENFFVNDLSLWYLRRSRKKFHSGNQGRKEAIGALYYVLLNLVKIIAPVMPFFAEEIYFKLRTAQMPESVHLCDWPETSKEKIDFALNEKMEKTRNIVSAALAERAEKGIKVRQPLSALKIKSEDLKNEEELLELIKEEVNVKKIVFDKKIEKEVELNTKMTPELEEEGELRDIIRHIQDMRKKSGLKPEDKISILAFGSKDLNDILNKKKDFILKETLAENLKINDIIEEVIAQKEVKINSNVLKIGIKKYDGTI